MEIETKSNGIADTMTKTTRVPGPFIFDFSPPQTLFLTTNNGKWLTLLLADIDALLGRGRVDRGTRRAPLVRAGSARMSPGSSARARAGRISRTRDGK